MSGQLFALQRRVRLASLALQLGASFVACAFQNGACLLAIALEHDATQGQLVKALIELAIRNLDRESSLLRQVKLALSRIQDSTFGTCLHCEEEINLKRLNAVPWAPYCITCQEVADRATSGEQAEEFEDELVNAA